MYTYLFRNGWAMRPDSEENNNNVFSRSMNRKKRVLVVGAAKQSGGGIASVIRLTQQMPMWNAHECYWLGTQIQAGLIRKMFFALRAYLKALLLIWRYDIVHFHTVPILKGPDMQLPVFLLAWMARKKIIMHIHVGNQLSYHDNNRLFKFCLNHADCAVFLSERWEKLFRERYSDVRVKETTVIYNACESRALPPYDASRKPYVLFAGSIDDNKAPDLLLKAFASLSERYADWTIKVLGNGDIARFRTMAAELGIADKVEFLGYQVGDAKRRLFSEASLYCMCSYVEGFPMVVLEAWSYGIPVITTPVGGLPDVLEEGRNAITFPFGDYQRLGEQLEYLIEHPEKREEMSRYGHEFVESRFSLPIINESYETLYK